MLFPGSLHSLLCFFVIFPIPWSRRKLKKFLVLLPQRPGHVGIQNLSDNVAVKQMLGNCLILGHATTHHNIEEILDKYLSGFFIEGEPLPLSLEVDAEAMRGAFHGAIVGEVAFNLSVGERSASRGKQVQTGNAEQCQEVIAKSVLYNNIKVGS